MKLPEADIYEIFQLFENALARAQRVDKKKKMQIRGTIRDEVFQLLTTEDPTASRVMKRWEGRLGEIFDVLPFGFRDELRVLLRRKMKKTQEESPQEQS
jgi:hypothetical protein